MTDIRAYEEIAERDCDGMHYRDCEYRMSDEEKTSQFGDLEFYARVVGYLVSFHAEDGTLKVSQDGQGMPILDWGMGTEEGFYSARMTFERIE